MSDEGTWVELDKDKHPGIKVLVEVVDGRVTIVGVQVLRPGGVRVDELRSVPIERLEAAWNDAASREGSATAKPEALRVGLTFPQAVARMGDVRDEPRPPTRRQLQLAVPEGGRYPDEFYVAVATLYQRLVAAGRQPAPELAKENDVPETTVHRWIREARRRGILGPGRKGRAG